MRAEVLSSRRAQGTGSRIPLALQAVFLASNRGKEVNRPPPERLACKTFFRGWMLKGLGKRKKGKNGGNSSQTTEGGKPSMVVQYGAENSDKDAPEMISTQPDTKAQAKPAAAETGMPSRPPMSPQAYLDVLIHSRGYSTRRYRTLQTGYYSKPTAFQQASYNVHLVRLVRNGDVRGLRSVISAGISPNPCNAYGESLVHMVCRRGDHELLKMLLESGTSVQVSDDYGRTPLHDACWAAVPSFETVELIGDRDIALFHMTDSRGAVPLSYVRREHWPLWIGFLESKKDHWWPPKAEEDTPGPLINLAPNEHPIPDPVNALSVELAGMVASGVMSPEEALILQDDNYDDDEDDESYEDSTEDDSDCDSLSESDSDYDSAGDELEAELLEGFSPDDLASMLSRVQHSKQHLS